MTPIDERRADMLVHVCLIEMERRDPGARAHAEHVAAMAEAIAAVMGFSEPALRTVRRAGLLHDVGKLGVRDAVLRKPERLTSDEYVEVQAHSLNGGRWLRAIPVLHACLPGVVHHHERWDGSGYPGHLAGRAIPLLARILAVADVFDALTSDRVYRPALPVGEAIDLIAQGAGTLFDPAIVALFLRAVGCARPALAAVA
jgi:HD-GYP domain-containing protein (c-di-GMP phosphodiesterase class II)